jgi:hypothetical protein
MKMEFGGGAVSCERLQMWLFSQGLTSNPRRGSSFQIITFIGVIVFRGKKKAAGDCNRLRRLGISHSEL